MGLATDIARIEKRLDELLVGVVREQGERIARLEVQVARLTQALEAKEDES